MATDVELLTQHRTGSQQAFAELAARHVNWVYSAALRRVRDAHLAEDVTQAVFMALANNRSLGDGSMVSSWLFEVLRFTSAKAVRAESRRRRHETAAARQRLMNSQTEYAPWDELAPMLEEAVAGLRRRDREAVLLRFYRQCSFAEMGQTLGISEEGARKRVSRTIKKLRDYFAVHGLTVADAALTDAMFEHSAQPAPAGLAVSVGIASAATKGGLDLFRHWLYGKRVRLLLHLAGSLAAVAASVALMVVAWHLWRPNAEPSPVSDVAPTSPASAIAAASATDPPTHPVSLTFEQIIAGIKQTEHQFQNVHVKDFETTVDQLPAGQTQWITTPIRYAGSAWYDSDPRGRHRIYMSDEVQSWGRDAAGWFEDAQDRSWDGKEGRVLRLATGSPNHLNRLRIAMVSTRREDISDSPFDPWITGVGYTAQYLVMNEDLSYTPKPRKPLSDTLQAISNVNGPPDIVGQTVNGFDTVRVHFGLRFGSESYWFDPSRGFSLVKRQNVVNIPKYPEQSRTEGLDVREFKRVGPGIWFPMQASMVRLEGVQTYTRDNFRAADVVVNDPKFDAAIFRASIPSGWAVDDVRGKTRRSYITMEDGSEMETHKGSVMPRMKAGVATRPDEPGPAITRDPVAWW